MEPPVEEEKKSEEEPIDFECYDFLEIGGEGPVNNGDRDQWDRQRKLNNRRYVPIVSRLIFKKAGSMKTIKMP